MPNLKIKSIDCQVCNEEVGETAFVGFVFDDLCYLYHEKCLPENRRQQLEEAEKRAKNAL